ncbi:hypothetical protein [Halovivax gelatinilyticus]|uniref:hypothetical protein n=1 Tax=Halovivax gelatinilyticus TaxID=2961597 RepID=UPI0020CA2FE3|nr:hypothetical protein [Halovivax gelatinilyticus]
MPTERYEPSGDGVFFTHVDWKLIGELNGDESTSERSRSDQSSEDDADAAPIVSIPRYGAYVTSYTYYGVLRYPFAELLYPQEGPYLDGIETQTMTWTDGVLIFHGTYDVDAFGGDVTDGFARVDENETVTIFGGTDAITHGLGFAVSEDAVVVGLDDDSDHDPIDLVDAIVDRSGVGRDRIVDTDDGRWLFDSTGDAQMQYGRWQYGGDDILGVGGNGSLEDERGSDDPVTDSIESVISNLAFAVEEGTMVDRLARFAAIYRDDDTPSESEVREHLLGGIDRPHRIDVGSDRISVRASIDA